MYDINKLLACAIESDTTLDTKATIIGNRAVESAIIVAAIKGRTTNETFISIANECGTELELYDVVEDEALVSDTANATKNEMETSPESTFAALKLAEENGDEDFEKHKKFSALADIYLKNIKDKYGAQGAEESAMILKNAAAKVSFIKSEHGTILKNILS